MGAGAAAGRWEVRIGLPGGRHVYLGLYATEPEAARVYDRALVLLSGPAAATNFPASNYSYEMSLYIRCPCPLPAAALAWQLCMEVDLLKPES